MRPRALGLPLPQMTEPCALVPPAVFAGQERGLEVCLHSSAEQVDPCLGRPGRLVVWPEAAGIVVSSLLPTEDLRETARDLRRTLRGGKEIISPSLYAWLSSHPFLLHALEALLLAELAAARAQAEAPRLTLLIPASLRLRRHHLNGAAGEQAWDPRPPVRLEPRMEAQEGGARSPSALLSVSDLPQEVTGGPFSLVPRPPRRFLSVHTLALAHAPVVVGEHQDAALGRGIDFQQAQLTAVFEALERRESFYDRQIPVRRASFMRLQDEQRALDPRLLLLPAAAPKGSSLLPYEASLELDWVAAHSLRHGAPVLVPARAALLGYQQDRLFLPTSSSGCALGKSLEEALLHALFEVIERDAFLLTWYARRPVVCLDLITVADQRILLLCDQAQRMGYDIRAYRTTLDAPLPSVWLLSVASASGRPHTLSSAGAHFQPEQAVISALVEVVGSLTMLAPGFDPARGRACMADPAEVRTAADHFHLFGVPEHFAELAFLEQGGRQALRDAFAKEAPLLQGRSLTAKLEALVRALLEQHADVLFVDLTSRRLRRHGLRCVRALVPGMLPMTFGHHNRRIHGSERLQRLREQVRVGSSREECLPHPFP